MWGRAFSELASEREREGESERKHIVKDIKGTDAVAAAASVL